MVRLVHRVPLLVHDLVEDVHGQRILDKAHEQVLEIDDENPGNLGFKRCSSPQRPYFGMHVCHVKDASLCLDEG